RICLFYDFFHEQCEADRSVLRGLFYGKGRDRRGERGISEKGKILRNHTPVIPHRCGNRVSRPPVSRPTGSLAVTYSDSGRVLHDRGTESSTKRGAALWLKCYEISEQFSRAIRKTALTCLLRLCRCFPHLQALSSWNCPLEKSCEHDFFSRTAPWLN